MNRKGKFWNLFIVHALFLLLIRLHFTTGPPLLPSVIPWQPTHTNVLLLPPENSASWNLYGPSSWIKKKISLNVSGKRGKRLQSWEVEKARDTQKCHESQREPSTTSKSVLILVQSPSILLINIHPSQKQCCPLGGPWKNNSPPPESPWHNAKGCWYG